MTSKNRKYVDKEHQGDGGDKMSILHKLTNSKEIIMHFTVNLQCDLHEFRPDLIIHKNSTQSRQNKITWRIKLCSIQIEKPKLKE